MEHHAYLYEGPRTQLSALAEDACLRFGFSREIGGELYIEEWEKFGIEEARALRTRSALKNITGRALYLVGVSSITTEAQQALLKLFEEPQTGMVFVLLVPPGVLLATLRSRFTPYPEELLIPGITASHPGAHFLSLPYKERSAYLSELLEEEEGARDRVRDFLQAIEAELYPHLAQSAGMRQGLADIALIRSYLPDRSASLKMLLEHVAATLPRTP